MTLSDEITHTVRDNQKESMRICPYCFSHRLDSMGFRDNTNTVRRFRCKVCGHSHSRSYDMQLITEVNMVKEEKFNIDNTPANRANKTLNITQATKIRVESYKIVARETFDEVLNRLMDNYEATKPQ